MHCMQLLIKPALLLTLLIGVKNIAMAQNCTKVYDSAYGQMVYTNPQKAPQFESRKYSSFFDYFSSNFITDDTVYWESRIRLEFIVDTNGRVQAARIHGKQRDAWSVKEKDAIKLLDNMPAWQPGYCDGKKVATKMQYPIICCFRG